MGLVRLSSYTLLLFAAAFVLASCASSASVLPPTSPDPATYVVAGVGDPFTLDPALDYESVGAAILLNVYDRLIFFDKSDPNAFVPQIALEVPSVENGGISGDGLTYTFNIRQGVTFHDGDPLTAEDVAYTFQRALLQGGAASPVWLFAEPLLGVSDVAMLVDESSALVDNPGELAAADGAELLAACQQVLDAVVADNDAGTVTFHLARPWAPFLATLAQSFVTAIIEQEWIVENGGWDGDCATWQNFYGRTAEEINQTAIGSSENGSGPYQLERWIPGEEIVLVANSNYWRTEPAWPDGPSGAPAIERIIIRNIPEFGTRLAMMQAGDADTLFVTSPTEWTQLDALAGEICTAENECRPSDSANQPLRVYQSLPTTYRTDILLNWQINTEGGNNYIGSGQLDGNGVPPDFFSNMHIRRAFAYCFDWETYIADALHGEAIQSKNVMLPGMIGYDEESPLYRYDPDQCRAEFDAAAADFQAQYGADLNEVGFRLSVLYATGNAQGQTIAEILQQTISLINEKFVLEVTGLPWPNFLQNLFAGKVPLIIGTWQEDIHDPHNWVVPYTVGALGGTQSLPEELQQQFAEIMERAVTAGDIEERHAIYQEFNQLFYEEVPTILLAVQLDRRYEQRWVEGWYHNPILPGSYFYALSEDVTVEE